MPKIVSEEISDRPSNKWSYSTFFITVNTNNQLYDPKKLRIRLRQLLNDDDDFYSLFRGTDLDTIDRDWTKVEMEVERGPKTGFVHAHMAWFLRHNGKIQVDTAFLQEILRRLLELSGVYVNVKGSGNPTASLKEYIYKNPAV